ncbi:MAG: class I SAM-dependent RNA methyltransferase [Candidatus Absconditicoccaceae bacterium]
MNLLITCPFGLGSLLANELKKIGLTPRDTFQTGIFLTTDMYNMMRINFWSRLANKVFIELASGEAKDFNQLFNLIKGSAYGQYLSNTKLSLKIQTKNSMLSASRAIQSVAHKALLESIANFGKEESFTTELLLSIENNKAHLYLNSSGTALYQRGYKTQAGEAPLKENLAVALLLLANRKFKSPLIDPFCGSGTIAIEAALLAKNIAPGSRRNFAFEKFKNFEAGTFEKIKQDAKAGIFKNKYTIFASDIDTQMINIAQNNAKRANVDDIISFQQKNFLTSNFHAEENTRIITNPPYGKRIRNQNLENIYTRLNDTFEGNIFGGWISTYSINKTKEERRNEKKLFNGNEQCYFQWRK